MSSTKSEMKSKGIEYFGTEIAERKPNHVLIRFFFFRLGLRMGVGVESEWMDMRLFVREDCL